MPKEEIISAEVALVGSDSKETTLLGVLEIIRGIQFFVQTCTLSILRHLFDTYRSACTGYDIDLVSNHIERARSLYNAARIVGRQTESLIDTAKKWHLEFPISFYDFGNMPVIIDEQEWQRIEDCMRLGNFKEMAYIIEEILGGRGFGSSQNG